MCDIADELDVSPARVALAWVRSHGKDVIPILGARRAPQLVDNLAVVDLALKDEHLTRLHDASKRPPRFPHSFIGRVGSRPLIYGVAREQLDL